MLVPDHSDSDEVTAVRNWIGSGMLKLSLSHCDTQQSTKICRVALWATLWPWSLWRTFWAKWQLTNICDEHLRRLKMSHYAITSAPKISSLWRFVGLCISSRSLKVRYRTPGSKRWYQEVSDRLLLKWRLYQQWAAIRFYTLMCRLLQ